MCRVIVMVLLFTQVLLGCSTSPKQQTMAKNSNLTHGNIQLTLKKGVTTKAQVLESFGAPNITTVDATEKEVWTYQKHAVVSNSNSNHQFATVILMGARASASGFEQSSKTTTLIIKFDENDKIYDFKSRSSSF